MPMNLMRYRRVSPDCLPPPSNWRKLCLSSFTDLDLDLDDDPQPSKRSPLPPFRPASLSRPLRPLSTAQERAFPSPSPSEPPTRIETHSQNKLNRHQEASCVGGDVLPQWGQNKRSRGPRAERSGSGDDSSNGLPWKRPRNKISVVGWKHASPSRTPPRGLSNPLASALTTRNVLHCRVLEERPNPTGGSLPTRPEKRAPPSSAPERMRKVTHTTSSALNGSSAAHVDPKNPPSTHSSEPDAAPPMPMATERLNLDLFAWPRIFISLSRKEKEDDFLAMKGTKLPQRPKKRAKNVDKNLQYCFPGMWLSELSKGRYEVREKKCVKKKRRGLKGMESMDSDSD